MSAASCVTQLDHQTCRGSSIGRACGSYLLYKHNLKVAGSSPAFGYSYQHAVNFFLQGARNSIFDVFDRGRKKVEACQAFGILPSTDFGPFFCFSFSFFFSVFWNFFPRSSLPVLFNMICTIADTGGRTNRDSNLLLITSNAVHSLPPKVCVDTKKLTIAGKRCLQNAKH